MIVDTREPVSLQAHVRAAGNLKDVNVEIEALGSGDILAGDCLIERKTYPDFVDRLTSTENSIWSQLSALNAACDEQGLRACMAIEGPWHEAIRHRNISAKAVNSAIDGVLAMGIEVIPTFDPEMTAYIAAKRAARHVSDGNDVSASAIRDSPDVPPSKRPRYLVEGLPGVGPKTADALLEHFGHAGGVFYAAVNTNNLTAVDGIGEKTAKDIQEALAQDYDG